MPLDMYCPSFEDGDPIPKDFTCDGDNYNPSFIISGVPEDAESLAFIVEDLDAEDDDRTVHWMVWNILPTTTLINEGEAPEDSMEGYNDFGNPEYSGPCPVDGEEHRYQFKLYALDIELELEEDASIFHLEKAVAGHILDEVTLVATYKR